MRQGLLLLSGRVDSFPPYLHRPRGIKLQPFARVCCFWGKLFSQLARWSRLRCRIWRPPFLHCTSTILESHCYARPRLWSSIMENNAKTRLENLPSLEIVNRWPHKNNILIKLNQAKCELYLLPGSFTFRCTINGSVGLCSRKDTCSSHVG